MSEAPKTVERFVDADEAAKFLTFARRRVLKLTRAGRILGYPIGDGSRHTWLFRLSEIAVAVKEMKSRMG